MKPRVLLLGGFGNQLFQIAFAIERFKAGEIEVESSFGSPRKNQIGRAEVWSYQLPPRLIEVNTNKNRLVSKFINFALIQSISSDTGLKSTFLKTLSRKIAELVSLIHFRHLYRIVLCDNVGFGKLSRKLPSNNDLIIGYFQSAKWFSDETISTLRSMKPISEIPEITHLIDAAPISKPIIVHVRLGDYELETGIGILPFKYYSSGLTDLTNKLPESEIWLFSNNLEKAKKLFSQWNGRTIRFIEDDWNSTVATFEAMRLGHGYLIANSTFSYWSALLSKYPDPVVIAPSPWFLHSEGPREILPSHWKVIDSI